MRLNARKYYHRLHSVPPEHYIKRTARAGGCPVVVAQWRSTGGSSPVSWVSSRGIYHDHTIVPQQVEMPGNATLFKEGFVMKKNIMDGPHKKGLLHTHHTHC